MEVPGAESSPRGANIEAHRLLAEARVSQSWATRQRRRVRRLAARYFALQDHKWAKAHQQLENDRERLRTEQCQFQTSVNHFRATIVDFHTRSREAQQRFQESWAELQRQQQRIATDRAESEAYLRQHEATLAAREADLARRLQRADDEKARLDHAIVVRRQELEGLETRAGHLQAIVQQAERRRDALAAANIPEAAPVAESPPTARVPLDRGQDRNLLTWSADLDRRELQVHREQARLTARQAAVARNETTVADQRTLLAEQFAMLAAARERWADAERHTLEELDDLAQVLRRREKEADERERHLIQAERRRREESYHLWQLRLKLEGWRGVLTAHEAWWQTESRRRDAELLARQAELDRGLAGVRQFRDTWMTQWQREQDHWQRETASWADANRRLEAAAVAYDCQRSECLATIASYAAKSLALDETFRETLGQEDRSGPARRFRTLRKRWERTFAYRRQEVESRLEALAREQHTLEAQARSLQTQQLARRQQTGATWPAAWQREAEMILAAGVGEVRGAGEVNREELTTLRAEVERLAFALMNADWPVREERPASDLGKDILDDFQLRAA